MQLSPCGLLSHVPLRGTWYRGIQPQFWKTSLQTSQTKVIASRFSAGAAAAQPFELLYLAENQTVLG